MAATTEIRDIDVTKTWVLESTLNFTAYFFKHNFGKKFIINKHHEIICDALDRVIQGKTKRLMINIAPRYSKTELVIKNFAAYGLAVNPASKFIHLSYSADLATDNSTEVQNTVTSEPFQELFELELTSNSKKKWKTSAGGGFYAISSGGQVTGFGAGEVQEVEDDNQQEDIEDFIPYYDSKFAGAILIDDPIKPDDALSDTKREAVNLKFDTTIRNRVNSRDTPIIIIMQRLHTNDLCGYLQELEGVIGRDEDGEWELIELPCLTTDPETGEDVALWPHKHTVEELYRMRAKNPFVFETQYQMNPKPKEGLMYERGFRTYDVVPYSQHMIRKNYTDTADTGKDFLCSIDYVETDTGNYILNVLYTQKPMEYTEVKMAENLTKYEIEKAVVESNGAGRIFARNVEAQCRIMNNNSTEFEWMHQGENKEVRIFTKSNEVQNLCYFPTGWENMWPDFYNHLSGYMKTGNNKHDDAPDALTGTVEQRENNGGVPLDGMFW